MSFTGNSSYTGNAAFAIEQSIIKDWQMIWTTGHPLLTVLGDAGTNFNKGFTINGLAMICAINGDDLTTPFAGVANGSAELAAMTYNQTAGFTQCKYYFGHYRGNYTILESEARLASNGVRGNLLEGKKKQFIGSALNKLSTDIGTATADASDSSRCLGMYQPLSTSNTVGGISQSTDTQWAANVTTGAGPFALELVDDKIDAIKAKKNLQRNNMCDLILASYASTNNVYGKFRTAIAPAERLVNANFQGKYGLENFIYMGKNVLMDNRIGTTLNGSLAILTTSSWFAYVDKTPRMQPLTKIPGTDAFEQVGTVWCGLGCNDPGLNGLVRDIS